MSDQQDASVLLGADPRIYAQMRPLEDSRHHLLELQSALPSGRGLRRTSADRLHLTLIHFGKVREVLASLRAVVPGLEEGAYLAELQGYLERSRQVLPDRNFTLDPDGIAGFGPGGRVLVVEYRPLPELVEVHAGLYAVLQDFLRGCGVEDVETFTSADANFRHAARLRPHVTLARGWSGQPLQLPDLLPVTLEPMPVLYR